MHNPQRPEAIWYTMSNTFAKMNDSRTKAVMKAKGDNVLPTQGESGDR